MEAAFLGVFLHLLRTRRRVSVRQLISMLSAVGYVTRLAVCRAMEAGTAFPDDAGRFIAAYAQALHLTDDEYEALVVLWTFAILRHELGESLAREILSHKLDAQAEVI
jgi:hypothetical protein